MSIKSAPYYWVECDRCGTRTESEYSAWSSDAAALDEAEESDWYAENDGQLCDGCQPHPPDWDEAHEAFAKGETDALACKWCKP